MLGIAGQDELRAGHSLVRTRNGDLKRVVTDRRIGYCYVLKESPIRREGRIGAGSGLDINLVGGVTSDLTWASDLRLFWHRLWQRGTPLRLLRCTLGGGDR